MTFSPAFLVQISNVLPTIGWTVMKGIHVDHKIISTAVGDSLTVPAAPQ